jgi:2-oxoglutarate dehydrogenase E2 component (dihydrolipoamide succinyltransferase)
MRNAVIMPQMGESIAEGTVVKWHKKPGDKVQRDEELFEISTDKVESVIPSPKSGFLAEILVGPGKKVPVDTVVAYLVDSAEELGGGSAPVAAAAPATAAAAAAPVVMSAAPAAAVVVGKDASAEELRRVRSTPLVRKIAAEKGVSLQQVAGTGLSGRVTKKDILGFLEKAPAAPVAVAEVAVGGATAVQYAPSVTVHAPNVPVGPNDRVEVMSVMRQSIADHMVMSRRVSAHCQTVHECDVTRIEKLREKYKDAYAQRGAKLSFTVFLTKAVADALRTFTLMNASLSGDKIIYHGDVNVGVAVALESGLIVPNVKRADELSMVGLAKAVGDMSERARTKKLKPEDVQHGTFSISNAGIFGSLFGVPIISQPNVGILGVGGIKKRVVVIDDEDNIAVRKMVYFCLTFDHRLIDGSTADGFMNKIKDTLQSFPEGLL